MEGNVLIDLIKDLLEERRHMDSLKSVLNAIEEKLSNLVKYENLLLNESHILKNMHAEVCANAKKTEKILKDFESSRYVFFRDFNKKAESIESTLKDLLSEYNIHFTLLKDQKFNK